MNKTTSLTIRTTEQRKVKLKAIAKKQGRSIDEMLTHDYKLDKEPKCQSK